MRPGYPVLTCAFDGTAQSSFFQAPGSDLWCVLAELGDAAVLQWSDDHGDEALFILQGELRVGDDTVGPGAAAVVESSSRPTVVAVGRTKVLHFGADHHDEHVWGPLGPPRAGSRVVHLGMMDIVDSTNKPTVRFFADGTCDTCRIMCFEVASRTGCNTGSHYHSEDELIYVLHGVLRVGQQRFSAGSRLVIPAGRRYSLRTDGPFAFVNYRRDATTIARNKQPPRLERGAAPVAPERMSSL